MSRRTSAASRPVADGNALRQRLAALRRRLRLVASFRGVSWLLAVVLTATALTGLGDWRWHLPPLARAVVLACTLAGGGAIVYRYLVKPLKARADDLALALRIEEHFPLLNDSLGSMVQFLNQAGGTDGGQTPGGDSAVLRREAVRRALGRVQGLDFNRVVDTRGLRIAGGSALAACVLAGVLLVLFPGTAATALVRLADPFGAHDWPHATQLELEKPRERVGRNEAFAIRGVVRGVIPPRATVVFRMAGFPPIEHECDIEPLPDGTGRLQTRLEPSRVQSDFRFQVRANDAVSQEYEVQVLPPPTLVALGGRPSPQVRLDFPRYTGLPSPQYLPPGSGNIDAVTGTHVTLRARADRPLRRAWVEYQPEVERTPLAAFLAPLGAPQGGPGVLGAVVLSAGSRPFWEPVAATLDEDRASFTLSWRPCVRGMYELHFEDETGLRGQRLFELRLMPDPAPVVRLERPAPSRDILDVLPVAELPLEVTADDALYGLRSAFVEYRTGRDERVQVLPLHDPDTFLGGQVGPWAGPAVLGRPAWRWRLTHLEFRKMLRLPALRHPDGSPLKAGDVVVVQAGADDFDDVSVGKEPGRSHQVEIRVVGREGLDLVLNQEQARVQQELVRLREKEREAIQKVTEAEGRLKKGEKLKEDDLAQLLQAEQLQQQIRERVGNNKEGLRAEVARVLRSLKQNGLENSAARFRMAPVQEELDRLGDRELEQIEPRLTNARQLAELTDAKARAERRAQLEQRAREAEGEARAAEESANKREEEAERAEQQAGKAGAERASGERQPPVARQQAEARRGRERAQELRQKARELREQAARDRAEAVREPEETEPRQALADTRKHQEEVEKTLNDLLARLEPWTSSREIKGEANRLLQDQRGLQGQVEQLMQEEKNAREDSDFFGKRRDELPERMRAELDNIKDAQRRLEERTDQLLNQMKRVGEQRAARDPETAQELKKAAEQAEAANVTGQMKTAARQIEQNQLGAAQKRQQESVAGLEQLAKNLEDRREAELDRLAKKLRQAEKKLAELEQQQERLQKKVREARKVGDKAQREEALKRLAREQQELRKQTEEMVQHLSRLRAERARQALDQAGGQMAQANRQLSRGEGEDEQEEALERLREARQEVQRAREQAEEELSREQMARLAEVLKRLKERQEGHNHEAERIQHTVLEGKRWTRGLRGSLRSLADNQKGLAEETAEVGRKDLAGAPVFARLLKRSAEAMEQASGRLGTMVREVPGLEDLPDREAGRSQQRALRNLEQLVAALKSAGEEMPPQTGGGAGQGEGGSEGGNRPAGDAIPPLAQLKLLRTMQQEVNEQTEAFKKKHPEPARMDDRDRAELEDLRRQQKDVADLLDELIRPGDEPGDREGEKK